MKKLLEFVYEITTGDYATIDWSNAPNIIKTETDLNGGQEFVTGTGARTYWNSTTFLSPKGGDIFTTYYYFNDSAISIHTISTKNEVRAI